MNCQDHASALRTKDADDDDDDDDDDDEEEEEEDDDDDDDNNNNNDDDDDDDDNCSVRQAHSISLASLYSKKPNPAKDQSS